MLVLTFFSGFGGMAGEIDNFSHCEAFISAPNVIYTRQLAKISIMRSSQGRIFIEKSRGTFKQGRVNHAISSGRQSASKVQDEKDP